MGKLNIKQWIEIIKNTFSGFSNDNGPKLSASLAYYTIFSLPALLVVVIGVGSIFYGKNNIQGDVFHYISSFVGDKTAQQIQDMLRHTAREYNNVWATILGTITLLIIASGIFAEIQDSINLIWGLKPKPKKGLLNFIFNRLLSFSMILVLGFVLLVSLLLNAILGAFLEKLKGYFSDKFVNSLLVIDYLVILIVIVFLFAAIFKILPDAKIKWSDVITGAIGTTVLFVIGKFLIGFYMKHFSNVSAYGTASSVIVILLWVYYTSIILYLGAEFTQAHVHQRGRFIEPYKYAIRNEAKSKLLKTKPAEDKNNKT